MTSTDKGEATVVSLPHPRPDLALMPAPTESPGSRLPSHPRGGEGVWLQPQGDHRVGTGYRVTRRHAREPDGRQAHEGRSLGSCACKVPSRTLPPNVLTPRDGDTVPNVQMGALSLRAAQLDPGSCEVWLLAQDSH